MSFKLESLPLAVQQKIRAELDRQQPAVPAAKEKPLIDPGGYQTAPSEGNRLTLYIPVRTASEVNGRDWRARSRRSNASWRAVSKVCGPLLWLLHPYATAYHEGKALKIVFTRLGGHKMDRSNLPSACKGVEDALAFIAGADDGDAKWSARFEQEPDAERVGVRIEIEIL
jgi:hypothetical protein